MYYMYLFSTAIQKLIQKTKLEQFTLFIQMKKITHPGS